MKRNEKLAAPMISRRNFEPYVSPADDKGRVIRSRKEAEKDMLANDCMPAQDVKRKPQHRTDNNGR